MTFKQGRQEGQTPNSTNSKVAAQWLNEALCFYQSLCLADSKVLLIPTFGYL